MSPLRQHLGGEIEGHNLLDMRRHGPTQVPRPRGHIQYLEVGLQIQLVDHPLQIVLIRERQPLLSEACGLPAELPTNHVMLGLMHRAAFPISGGLKIV
jgi:hypothetical protein